METRQQDSNGWKIVFLAALLPLIGILGMQYDLPGRFLIPALMIIALVAASLLIWMNANTHTTGDEWWQDDSCSGWRGR